MWWALTYHTDQLGTTRAVSDANGMLIDSIVFTAFGEPISGLGQRLGHAGAHGYQSLTPHGSPVVPGTANLLHLGYRYYDPVSGRSLQRDPIGVLGDSNVYAYVENAPTIAVDASGLATTLTPFSLAGAGFSAKEIASILACGTAFAAVKSWDEWKKHTDGLERGKDLVRRLKELRKHLKKKRYKDATDKAIKEETKKIKGHEKEIKQKWPNGPPAG